MLKRKNIYIYLISGLFFTFVGYMLHAANTGRALLFFEILDYIPMGDKLVHIVMMGTLAFLLNLMLDGKTLMLFGVPILLGSLIAVGFVTIEEFSQMYIPTRKFDWIDLAANYVGITWASRWQVLSSKIQIPNSN